MKKRKEDKGITLMVLVVMIIVLMILAGVTITGGTVMITKTKMENYITNMITIRAKAKVYAEEINAEVWDSDDASTERESLYESKYGMIKIPTEEVSSMLVYTSVSGSNYECYKVTATTLEEMGLDSLVDEINDVEYYVVVYNSNDYSDLDVIYSKGVQYSGSTYYTLSNMQTAMEE